MRTLRRIAPLFAILVLALQSWAQPLTTGEKEEVLAKLGEIVTERAFVPGVDMTQWPTFLEKHREAIDKTEQHEPFARAVNAALHDFGLSHLRLRSPAATKQRDTNSMVGLGIGTEKEDETLRIITTAPKSPAEEAGLQPGDKIVQVDGHKPGEPGELRGEEGTEVTLKIAKPDGTESELKLKRARISLARTDTLAWPEDDVAVLKINTFAKGYDRQTIKELVDKAAEKAKFLIIDLRSNGGGATNNLQHFLSQVLPANSVVGTFVSRRAVDQYVEAGKGDGTDVIEVAKWWTRKFKTARNDPPWTGKMAVLINGGSASASEIAAAGLHEITGAPLVGQRSAGAVLASVYGTLPHGFSVQYPIDDYVTAKGERLEGHKRQPDAVVTSPRRAPAEIAADPVVKKAIAMLKGAPAEAADKDDAKDDTKADSPKKTDASSPAANEKGDKPAQADGKGGLVLIGAPSSTRRAA